MKALFRADASWQIGSGHIMRCLTLADALTARGVGCQFICRAHEGNLIKLIHLKGYVAHVLPMEPGGDVSAHNITHSHWLGATPERDAEDCLSILAAQRPDWLIVDHYALDLRWEQVLSPCCDLMMVIDDLADRKHVCDILVDQTFGRKNSDYDLLVPASCQLLCGSRFALLRPEFAAIRPYSLSRRTQPALRELLITMGGVDKDNATGQVLDALHTSALPSNCRITVVIGEAAPWLSDLQKQARGMPWQTRVLAGVTDMAKLMADSDLAIGAAGATSWERCCLGLPTLMLVLADNQHKVAQGLDRAGAAKLVGQDSSMGTQFDYLLRHLMSTPKELMDMSHIAAGIVDGHGVNAVVQEMGG